MAVAVSPGEHHLCPERQSVQASMEREAGFTSFTAEANKRYYFRAQFAEHSGVNLERINEDEGRFLLSSSGLRCPVQKNECSAEKANLFSKRL
jgi:hypothetical protein